MEEELISNSEWTKEVRVLIIVSIVKVENLALQNASSTNHTQVFSKENTWE